ncbi:hypothetical protein BD289DRAFT_84695 [Coniella lustricola]|uniref:Uncharacterized protein n=1 Tax=Coniella lustricola TaxID=2025994 RepID=A0A2T2ZZ04_9PEZI|nr:hypothetical protein BD289DRAFT_84695 [Coniella lustricola]
MDGPPGLHLLFKGAWAQVVRNEQIDRYIHIYIHTYIQTYNTYNTYTHWLIYILARRLAYAAKWLFLPALQRSSSTRNRILVMVLVLITIPHLQNASVPRGCITAQITDVTCPKMHLMETCKATLPGCQPKCPHEKRKIGTEPNLPCTRYSPLDHQNQDPTRARKL